MVKQSQYKFFMQRITVRDDGIEVASAARDLETDSLFAGLRYKEFKGLESYGKPHPYSEMFVDIDKSLVYIPNDTALEPTTLKLTLYFFDPEDNDNLNDAIVGIDRAYHNFVDFVQGARIIYWDTARKRKVMMYLTDKTEPTTDRISSNYYKEVTFTFTNVYGRSFALDDRTFGGVVFPDLQVPDLEKPVLGSGEL